MDSTGFQVIAIMATALQGLPLFLALFEPALRYRISHQPSNPLDSERFRNVLATLADSSIRRHTTVVARHSRVSEPCR